MKDNIKLGLIAVLVCTIVIGIATGVGFMYYNKIVSPAISEQSQGQVLETFDNIKGVTYYRTVEDYKQDVINNTLPKDCIYVIQPGDTLTSISSSVGRSVDELAQLNAIKNVNLIYADSSLRVPSSQ